ncbi:uncharacterized protein METZ01_LOCUS433720 [marine metagenome]|uniref:Uncharacterized protein n=1 Tax=marine metagenome TaxID=408172 RepID=A0A382YC23_9ZZZZ
MASSKEVFELLRQGSLGKQRKW